MPGLEGQSTRAAIGSVFCSFQFLSLFFALCSWMSWIEKLSSAISFLHAIISIDTDNHGQNPLKIVSKNKPPLLHIVGVRYYNK